MKLLEMKCEKLEGGGFAWEHDHCVQVCDQGLNDFVNIPYGAIAMTVSIHNRPSKHRIECRVFVDSCGDDQYATLVFQPGQAYEHSVDAGEDNDKLLCKYKDKMLYVGVKFEVVNRVNNKIKIDIVRGEPL